MNELILASSSKYRQFLLKQLGVSFTIKVANIDETAQVDEKPIDLVKRLSMQKAVRIATEHTSDFVIGSDQIAVFKNQIIGKPLEFNVAREQLKYFSGNTIEFFTGVALICIDQRIKQYRLSKVSAKFRQLSETEINDYLTLDEPFDCAGSFKIEANGARLFETVKSDDPTSLQGLPIMTLNSMLRASGAYHSNKN